MGLAKALFPLCSFLEEPRAVPGLGRPRSRLRRRYKSGRRGSAGSGLLAPPGPADGACLAMPVAPAVPLVLLLAAAGGAAPARRVSARGRGCPGLLRGAGALVRAAPRSCVEGGVCAGVCWGAVVGRRREARAPLSAAVWRSSR